MKLLEPFPVSGVTPASVGLFIMIVSLAAGLVAALIFLFKGRRRR